MRFKNTLYLRKLGRPQKNEKFYVSNIPLMGIDFTSSFLCSLKRNSQASTSVEDGSDDKGSKLQSGAGIN